MFTYNFPNFGLKLEIGQAYYFFVFYDLWSMGICIKLVTTISLNFFLTFEKVGKLRSYGFKTRSELMVLSFQILAFAF